MLFISFPGNYGWQLTFSECIVIFLQSNRSTLSKWPRLECSRRSLSIQQKFRFEISEIPLARWNGTFRSQRPEPSHRAFGYCSCQQDATDRYRGQQFCQMKRDISVRPTEMTRKVKEVHLQSWSPIFRSNQTEMSGNLGWMESPRTVSFGLAYASLAYTFCDSLLGRHDEYR